MAPLALQLLPRCEAGDGNCWLHTTTTTLLLPLPSSLGMPTDYTPVEAQTKTITLTYSQSGASVVVVPEPGPTLATSTLPIAGPGADIVSIVAATTAAPGVQPTALSDSQIQAVESGPAPTAAPTVMPSATVSQNIESSTALPTANPEVAQRPISGASSPAGAKLRHTGSIKHPNGSQVATIWAAAVMFVSILVAWGVVVLRDLLYPWKLFSESGAAALRLERVTDGVLYRAVNVIHEGSHIFGE